MRLSWNEIRARAADFAREWADATYEKGETQSFYNEFFDIFGVRRRTVARYEEHVRRLDNTSGFIDLFWPGVLLVEQKSAGRNLAIARRQAGGYFDALPERDRPRYQLLCDFQTFELLDREEREETRFALVDLPQHVEKFGFIIASHRRRERLLRAGRRTEHPARPRDHDTIATKADIVESPTPRRRIRRAWKHGSTSRCLAHMPYVAAAPSNDRRRTSSCGSLR